MKTFGTRGPVDPAENYVVQRTEEIADFIKRVKWGHYIVLHAPQKTGKTTFFRLAIDALAVEEPTYFIIQLNFENRENLSAADFYQVLCTDLCEELKQGFQKRGNVPAEALPHSLENAEITNNVDMRRFYRAFEKFLENQKLVIFIEKTASRKPLKTVFWHHCVAYTIVIMSGVPTVSSSRALCGLSNAIRSVLSPHSMFRMMSPCPISPWNR